MKQSQHLLALVIFMGLLIVGAFGAVVYGFIVNWPK